MCAGLDAGAEVMSQRGMVGLDLLHHATDPLRHQDPRFFGARPATGGGAVRSMVAGDGQQVDRRESLPWMPQQVGQAVQSLGVAQAADGAAVNEGPILALLITRDSPGRFRERVNSPGSTIYCRSIGSHPHGVKNPFTT